MTKSEKGVTNAESIVNFLSVVEALFRFGVRSIKFRYWFKDDDLEIDAPFREIVSFVLEDESSPERTREVGQAFLHEIQDTTVRLILPVAVPSSTKNWVTQKKAVSLGLVQAIEAVFPEDLISMEFAQDHGVYNVTEEVGEDGAVCGETRGFAIFHLEKQSIEPLDIDGCIPRIQKAADAAQSRFPVVP